MVLAEVASNLGGAKSLLEMLRVGDLEVGFDLEEEKIPTLAILRKYREQRIDLADACVVRMSEIYPDSVVYTADKKDFKVYRRNGNKVIPCVFPESLS